MGQTLLKGKIKFKDNTPAVNYKVKVYDWDVGRDDFLGETTIDQSGNYSINIENKKDWGKRRKGRFADVYIQVFPSDSSNKVYQSDVHWNISQSVLIIDANVDSFNTTTKGRIIFNDGTPAAGYKVRVWDHDPIKDDFLGEEITNSNGEYSVVHRTKQDVGNINKNRFADIYMQVIEKDGLKAIYTSSTYNNYSKPTLIINASLDRVLMDYGANCIYGQILYKKHDGRVLPASNYKVKAYDRDAGFDDLLGEDVTDSNGEFTIHGFTKEDYKNWFEGDPDVYLNILKDDKVIWKTKTDWSANLPLKYSVEIPEIIVKGKIRSYKYDNEDRDIEKLEVNIWDFDSIQVGPIPIQRDFLAKANLVHNPDQKYHEFRTAIYGSGDNYSGSDIIVAIKDKEYDKDVWTSEQYEDVESPKIIDIGIIDIKDETYVLPDDTNQTEPGAGTEVTFVNLSGEERYIYKNSTTNIPESILKPNAKFVDFLACGEMCRYYIKNRNTDTYNETLELYDLVGLCGEEVFKEEINLNK